MPPEKQQGQGAAVTRGSDGAPVSGRRRRWRRPAVQRCHCCNREYPFCWRCRCGFEICQACMGENVWGMSCNNITWQCPDCGKFNGFGNQ